MSFRYYTVPRFQRASSTEDHCSFRTAHAVWAREIPTFWVIFPLPRALPTQPPIFVLTKLENTCWRSSEAAAAAGMDLTEGQSVVSTDPQLLDCAALPWRGPPAGSQSQPGAGRRSRGTRATASARTWGCARGWSRQPRTCKGTARPQGLHLSHPRASHPAHHGNWGLASHWHP